MTARVDEALVDEHRTANASALGHYAAFAGHRERLTALVAGAAPASGAGTLCVLGAGNVFDLDLEILTQTYGEICLVDIDPAAVAGAIGRQTPEVRAKLRAVAPVDLSGLMDRIERWARRELTPVELMNHGERTASAVRRLVNTESMNGFDVVVSACMLSQMHLDVVRVLGETHPLFQAVRLTLSVAHLRTLAALTKVGGKVVFATDVTAATLYPLGDPPTANVGLELLNDATRSGNVFDFARPEQVRSLLDEDPALARAFPTWQLADAWVWQNGPTTRFLVYGAVLPRV
jgi:hypothetical protein